MWDLWRRWPVSRCHGCMLQGDLLPALMLVATEPGRMPLKVFEYTGITSIETAVDVVS